MGNLASQVKVKGPTGGLGPVLVTAGEVQAAKNDGFRTDPFIVHGIRLVEIQPGRFEGSGGTINIIENWQPDDTRLRPIQYEYTP